MVELGDAVSQLTELVFYQYKTHVEPHTRQSTATTQNSAKLPRATNSNILPTQPIASWRLTISVGHLTTLPAPYFDLQLRKALDIVNRLTLYVLLVDQKGRVRWRGTGKGTPDEIESLIRCARQLAEEGGRGADDAGFAGGHRRKDSSSRRIRG